jgi:ABC-2 type transport system permease protein
MTPQLRALFRKELIDVSRNRAALLPVAIVAVVALALPFVIAVLVPAATGQRLGSDADLVRVSIVAGGGADLGPDARVQLFLFQQFLMLFLLTPITSAMALAAHAIVGEKQARTLEPLLATPITTLELLTAKVLGAFIPAAGLSLLSFAMYVAGTLVFARPGVAGMLFLPRSLVTVFVLGPLAALSALQLAVCVSSRVNDSRSAQQIGALVILPVMGLMLAQLFGALVLTGTVIAVIAAALLLLNALLMWVGVILFQREAILTRWT